MGKSIEIECDVERERESEGRNRTFDIDSSLFKFSRRGEHVVFLQVLYTLVMLCNQKQ